MSSRESLLPVYKYDQKKDGCGIVITFFKFGWITISLPFFSFLFCVIWSIKYNFADANATHCAVDNYFPSVSAAIGAFYPQKYVWMFSISLHFIPRIMVSNLYLKYFYAVIDPKYTRLFRITWFSNVCENCFLLGLTLIASTSHYPIHAFCFTSFLITSLLYMVLSCFLLKFRRKYPPTNLESRTLKWKFQCLAINMLCFFVAGYFFVRHNKYCEPGVYSLFALFEYGVVLTNMGFHILAVWDFYDKTVIISSRGISFS